MDTKGGIFNELRRIQERCGGYIPELELYRLAAALQKSTFEKGEFVSGVCDVYSVATFYPEFRFARPPKVELRVCTALPCFLKGAEKEYRRIESAAEGRKNVSVGRCPCLGRCDQAPAMTVNGHIFAAPEQASLSSLAEAYLNWADPTKAGTSDEIREAPRYA